MANINLYELYNNKRRKFGVNDSSRYQGAFVEAVNHAFATFNSEIFQADTLEYIQDFNDIISQRLASFTQLAFDDGENMFAAMSGREYWAVEYHLERKNSTNTFTDTITDNASNVVIAIADDELTITGDSVVLTATLPDANSFRLLINSSASGIRILTDDTDLGVQITEDSGISLDDVPDLDWVPDLEVIPSLGDTDTPQPIGTVSARVIDGVAGFELISTAFYSSKTKLFEFLLNEATGTTVNSVEYMGATNSEGYSATLTAPKWITTYVEESCGLDRKYYPYFDSCIEYYLQQGGEWAIEPDVQAEGRMRRNIRNARNKYNTDSTYTGIYGTL